MVDTHVELENMIKTVDIWRPYFSLKGNVVCQNYKRKSESNQLTVYEYKVRLKNFPFDKKIITKHCGKIEFVDISQTSHFENSVFVIT